MIWDKYSNHLFFDKASIFRFFRKTFITFGRIVIKKVKNEINKVTNDED